MKKAIFVMTLLAVCVHQVMICGCNVGVTGVTVFQPELCESGYTLLTSFGAHEYPPDSGVFHGALLIDMEGELVHEWKMVGWPVKMLPEGHVMGYSDMRGDGTGHQETEALMVVDWFGNEVWRWDRWEVDVFGNPICRGHHDFEREGNPVGYYIPGVDPFVESGRSLVLVHENEERPDIAPWTIEDDVIVEIDYEGNILWEWHATDHFDDFCFTDAAKAALQAFQVTMPDYLGGGADITDWLHINSVSWLGPNRWWDSGDTRFHPDNIIVDSRSSNMIWIIEKSTGDIVWKVGPDYSLGQPERKLGQLIGQHHAHVIPEGLPGAGNILVFDNGGAAGYGSWLGEPIYPSKLRAYSRVIEFDPITLDLVWEYERRLPQGEERFRFYSYYISGAQRLVNGNTLITEGATGRVFEVTVAGELAWEYISPYHDASAAYHQGTLFQFANDLYRAYRVPYDYIPEALLARGG